MLDRHAVQELVRAQVTARAIAKQFGVSVRTVRRIVREVAVEVGDAEEVGEGVQFGRRCAVVQLKQDFSIVQRPDLFRLGRENVRSLSNQNPFTKLVHISSIPRRNNNYQDVVPDDGHAAEFDRGCRRDSVLDRVLQRLIHLLARHVGPDNRPIIVDAVENYSAERTV